MKWKAVKIKLFSQDHTLSFNEMVSFGNTLNLFEDQKNTSAYQVKDKNQ